VTEPPAAPLRVRLDVAYDGTGFSGWARQAGSRTVQGELEQALAVVFRRFPPVPGLVVAGRTDAGVHATGQVAHLDLERAQLAALLSRGRRPSTAAGEDAEHADADAVAQLARRLNGIAGLAADVHVARATVAHPAFDARFSAVWRRYEYRVADDAATRDPLRRASTLWYPAVLDERAMADAAVALTGLHDFASYCRARPEATTIRTLQEFTWRRDPDGVLAAGVRADAFCHSMVRALVGASIAVGQGRLDAEALVAIRDRRERGSEFKVAPAKGLTLVEVGYPRDDELEARTRQTRARREVPGSD
jgi:tRNA pseudouridine38-40 synthase